jgi:hypothetical protein
MATQVIDMSTGLIFIAIWLIKIAISSGTWFCLSSVFFPPWAFYAGMEKMLNALGAIR